MSPLSLDLMRRATLAATRVRPFLPFSQLSTMLDAARGDEGDFFLNRFIDLCSQIDGMPVTYAQDGMGDAAICHLHYFLGGSDWYIIEKDVEGGIDQAFGYAVLNGDVQMAECGYISIRELTAHGAELDLYFTPCTLATVRAKHINAAGLV